MNTRKPERQILLPALSDANLLGLYLVELLFRLDDLLHNAKQDRLFGVLHTFPEAQNRIESEAESHV